MPGPNSIPTSSSKPGISHSSQASGTQTPKGFFARLRQLLGGGSSARASGTSAVSAASLPPLAQHGLAVGTPPAPRAAAAPDAAPAHLDAKQRMLRDHQTFDTQVVKDHPDISLLPSALRNSEEFKALGRELHAALTEGGGQLSADQIKGFSTQLHTLLNKDSVFGGIKLNLVLTDGTAFMNSLLDEARKGQPASPAQSPAAKTALAQIYDKAMVDLGDHVENGGSVIVVNGETYTHSERIGSGQFGQADVYVSTKLHSKMPKLVVKRPKLASEGFWTPPAHPSAAPSAGAPSAATRASAGDIYAYAAASSHAAPAPAAGSSSTPAASSSHAASSSSASAPATSSQAAPAPAAGSSYADYDDDSTPAASSSPEASSSSASAPAASSPAAPAPAAGSSYADYDDDDSPAASSSPEASSSSAPTPAEADPYGYDASAHAPAPAPQQPQPPPSPSHFKIDIPAREGRQLVRAIGTGATDDITPILGAIRTEDSLLLVFPYETHGSYEHQLPALKQAIAQQPGEAEAKAYAQAALTPLLGLSRGIERLQLAKGQMHGDIAPRNVLITAEGKGRLADFGLAKQMHGTGPADANADKTEGSFPIRQSAPEVLKKARGRKATVTGKADTWMFGMALFEVLHGDRYNWQLPDGVKAMDHIANLQQPPDLPPIPAPWPESMKGPLQQLMADCLKINPEERPSMDEIQRRLRSDLIGVGSPEAEALLQQVLTS